MILLVQFIKTFLFNFFNTNILFNKLFILQLPISEYCQCTPNDISSILESIPGIKGPPGPPGPTGSDGTTGAPGKTVRILNLLS